MKKKSVSDADVVGLMNKIQAQLAVLDRKLDSFMTKSLTELAQAKAATMVKPAPVQQQQPQAPRFNNNPQQHPGRQMYDVVCFDCGKDTQIPFKPTGDRPVYCKECFTKRKAGGNMPKPSAAPSLSPMTNVTVTEIKTSELKKKSAAKKPAAKKKAVAKKKARKK